MLGMVGRFGKKIRIVPFAFLLACALAGVAKAETSVPYVGCPGTDMGGDSITPPPGHPISLDIAPGIAAHLAFYYGQHIFVLAPRGWVCASQSGNTESDLWLRPPNANPDNGPVIYLVNWSADPTGYRTIEAYGGTYFPNTVSRKALEYTLAQLGGSKKQFLVPKFPKDQLTYLNADTLEYVTPPKANGLGTWIIDQDFYDSNDKRSNLPTYGVLGLITASDDRWINIFAVRLPPQLNALRRAILDFTAHCEPFDSKAACAGQIDFGQ